MAHKLLLALDQEYKERRAALISEHYKEIVGEIDDYFQKNLLAKISDIQLKEIIKFDYMTNIKEDGDKHLWIHFIDSKSKLYRFKVVVCSTKGSYCILEDEKFDFNTINFTLEDFEEFSDLCLSEFRRGYDKPKVDE